MTISRAIAMLRDLIDFKLKAAIMMRDGAPESNVGDLARQAANLHDKEREKLERILKELDTKPSKNSKRKSELDIKDLIAKQVRIQVAKELRRSKVKHDSKRTKKPL